MLKTIAGGQIGAPSSDPSSRPSPLPTVPRPPRAFEAMAEDLIRHLLTLAAVAMPRAGLATMLLYLGRNMGRGCAMPTLPWAIWSWSLSLPVDSEARRCAIYLGFASHAIGAWAAHGDAPAGQRAEELLGPARWRVQDAAGEAAALRGKNEGPRSEAVPLMAGEGRPDREACVTFADRVLSRATIPGGRLPADEDILQTTLLQALPQTGTWALGARDVALFIDLGRGMP